VEERRGALRRAPTEAALTGGRLPRRVALIAAAWLAAGAGLALACETPLGFTARERLTSGEVVVMFRTVPAAIQVGRHFSVEAIVCAAPPTQGLRVDAHMPEHRHGMNYRPTVAATGNGRYVAEGMMFHMPGRWRLVFDVELAGRTERLATDILLE
jgi:hypothetical protein